MIDFSLNAPKYKNDLEDIIRLFFPHYGLKFCQVQSATIQFILNEDEQKLSAFCTINGTEFCFEQQIEFLEPDRLKYRRCAVRFAKHSLYTALKAVTGREMAWGSLTGIRPTKPARELLASGISLQSLPQEMSRIYGVGRENASIIAQILQSQSGYLPQGDELNVYIHIPFCQGRCSYCSFPSGDIRKNAELLQPYLDALKLEIKHAYSLISRRKIFSTYIGGGTPTVLDDKSLESILEEIKECGKEFTLEAGRADSITQSKLELARRHNVDRICVNPQTFNENTLRLIGRNHTNAQFYQAYELASSMGFKINIDLIAGLMGENNDDFIDSLGKAMSLKPHNITAHTLSLKAGAKIKEQRTIHSGEASKMIEYSRSALKNEGFAPYYLYRQKYSDGNNENIGWAINGYQCLNNISVMEELLGVMACGAGAISKFIFKGNNRIERLANPKDLKTYLEKLPQILIKKEELYSKSII